MMTSHTGTVCAEGVERAAWRNRRCGALSRQSRAIAPTLLLLIACNGRSATNSTATTPATATPAASEAAASNILVKPASTIPASTVNWQAGVDHQMRLELDNTTTMAMGTLAQFELRATLLLRARELGSGVELVGNLRDVQFSVPDVARQKNFDELQVELTKPFLFALEGGRLLQPRVSKGSTAFAISLWRTIAAALQVSLPPGGDSAPWQVEEEDATGEYMARYEGTSEPGVYHKKKLSYAPLILTAATDPARRPTEVIAEVLSSEGQVKVEQRRLEAVEYREQLRVASAPTAPTVAETRFTLVRRQTQPSAEAPDWDVLQSGMQPADFSNIKASSSSRAEYNRLRIGNYTFDSALEELSKSAKHAAEPAAATALPEEEAQRKQRLQEQAAAFSAMAALIETEPQVLPKAERLVRASSSGPKVALLDAMATAGTEPAQKALVRVMNEAALSKELRQAAAFAIMRLRLAEPATVAALAVHLKGGELQQYALYGLGTISRRLRENGEPKRAKDALQPVLGELDKPLSDPAKVHVLRAIANSGNVIAFERVRRLLSSKEPTLRAAAVDAIRLMDHPDVDNLLSERLASDPDRGVHAATIAAIALRQPSEVLTRALTSALPGPMTVGLKLRAVDILGEWSGRQPELVRELEKVASTNELPRVREAARRQLAAHETISRAN